MNYKRDEYLPYALPWIGEEEIQEVVDSLRSGWVTTGPKVKRFEQEFAQYVGSRHAVALSSCTAALHVTLAALGIGPGDEVIVPTMTFCSTGNVVAHLGAKPVLVDTNEDFHISAKETAKAINSRTRAIVPVHYGGQACDLDELIDIANRRGIPIVEDAAHAAGCEYRGRRIGVHGLATAFSFYATKNMTTGEGGMLTTNDDELAGRVRLLSLHGMSRDAWKRYTQAGSWYYEISEAGYKDNMTDIQASLGIHQLQRLDGFNKRRTEIARRYTAAFSDLPGVKAPHELPDRNHIYHVYAIQLTNGLDRSDFIRLMKEAGIGTSVHFIPLHRHPFYQRTYGYSTQEFPMAEELFEGLVSIPLYPKMSDRDVDDVIGAVRSIVLEHTAEQEVVALA